MGVRGRTDRHGLGVPLRVSTKRCHPAKERGVCHGCKARACVGATERRGLVLRAYPKTAGDWLILRSLRSKMCLSPSPPRFWDRLLGDFS